VFVPAEVDEPLQQWTATFDGEQAELECVLDAIKVGPGCCVGSRLGGASGGRRGRGRVGRHIGPVSACRAPKMRPDDATDILRPTLRKQSQKKPTLSAPRSAPRSSPASPKSNGQQYPPACSTPSPTWAPWKTWRCCPTPPTTASLA